MSSSISVDTTVTEISNVDTTVTEINIVTTGQQGPSGPKGDPGDFDASIVEDMQHQVDNLENEVVQVKNLAQSNELKISTKADHVELKQAQNQIDENRLALLTKADQQALAMLSSLVGTKADQAYVQQQIASLVGSAPEALNTIYELAAAIQNEQDILDILNQSVANRVRFDVATQVLTELQKENARTNIGSEAIGTAQQLVSQITAASIGAATAAQGAQADTALQSDDVAPVALLGLFSSLAGQSKIFDVVFNAYSIGSNTAIAATDTLGQMLGKLQKQIDSIESGFDQEQVDAEIKKSINVSPYEGYIKPKSSNNSIAIGDLSLADNNSIVIGNNSRSTFNGAVFGNTNNITSSGSLCVGNNNIIENGAYNTVMGVNSYCIDSYNIISLGIGNYCINGVRSVFYGSSISSEDSQSNVFVGNGISSSYNASNNAAFGNEIQFMRDCSDNLALGRNITLGSNCIGVGKSISIDTAYESVFAFGNDVNATASNQVQLGNTTTTTYTYGTVQDRSDSRDKADVSECTLGLDFINQLKPKKWKWDYREDYVRALYPLLRRSEFESDESYQIAETQRIQAIAEFFRNPEKDGSKTRERWHYGLIADDLKQTLDNLGIDFGAYQDHSIDGGLDVKTVGYIELIAPMLKAIQELSLKVKKLEQK